MEGSSGEEEGRSYRNPSPPAPAAGGDTEPLERRSRSPSGNASPAGFPAEAVAMAPGEMEMPECASEGIGGTVLTKFWVLDLLVRTVEYARAHPGIPDTGSGEQAVGCCGPEAPAAQEVEDGQQSPGNEGQAVEPREQGLGGEQIGGGVPADVETVQCAGGVVGGPEVEGRVVGGGGVQGVMPQEAVSPLDPKTEEEPSTHDGGGVELGPKPLKTEQEGCVAIGPQLEAGSEIEPQYESCEEKAGTCQSPKAVSSSVPEGAQSSVAVLQSSGLEREAEEPEVAEPQDVSPQGDPEVQNASPSGGVQNVSPHGGDSSDVSSHGAGRRSHVSSDGYGSGRSDERIVSDASSGMDSDLEEELCILWDASVIQDVADFLYHNGSVDCLLEVAEGTTIKRLKEVCIGIVGNMACFPHICRKLLCRHETMVQIMSFLESGDSRVLTETIRCVGSCLGHPETKTVWLDLVRAESNTFLKLITFFLKSSTNDELLKNIASLLDQLLDTSDEILHSWASNSLVEAIFEAIRQTRSSSPSTGASLLMSLQLLSTIESGVSCLVSHQNRVVTLSLQYLRSIDHVDSTNHLSALAAASLLSLIRNQSNQELCLDRESREVLERLLAEAREMEVDEELSPVHTLKNLLQSFLTE